MPSQPIDNHARSVVRSWRDEPDRRATAWGPAALDKSPSHLTSLAAIVYERAARQMNDEINSLLQAGFLTTHPYVTKLIEQRDNLTRQRSLIHEWSKKLYAAENEETK